MLDRIAELSLNRKRRQPRGIRIRIRIGIIRVTRCIHTPEERAHAIEMIVSDMAGACLGVRGIALLPRPYAFPRFT